MKSIRERLYAKLEPTSETDCWVFQGSRGGNGYGRLMTGSKVDGTHKPVGAHRLMWALHNGPIPTGMSVLHKCDNPPCCNPAHLFLGTQADNMRDKARKGRDPGPQQTHCKHGHEYTAENTIRRASRGQRSCRACHRRRTLAWWRKTHSSHPGEAE